MLNTDTSLHTELPPNLKQALESSYGVMAILKKKEHLSQLIYIAWLSKGIQDLEDEHYKNACRGIHYTKIKQPTGHFVISYQLFQLMQ